MFFGQIGDSCNITNLNCSTQDASSSTCQYAFIYNVPSHYQMSDILRFFIDYIDNNALCDIVYIQRPVTSLAEIVKENFSSYPIHIDNKTYSSNKLIEQHNGNPSSDKFDIYPFEDSEKETKSCLIRIKSNCLSKFLNKYNNVCWDMSSDAKTMIFSIKPSKFYAKMYRC